MEQPTSDSSSSANLVYILRQFHRMGCDRKLLEERQTDRQRQRRRGFRVIGIAVAVTGHFRPSFYTLSVPPSFPDFSDVFWVFFLLLLLVFCFFLLLLLFVCCCCCFFFFFTNKKLLRTVAYTNLSHSLLPCMLVVMLIHV